MRLVPVIFSPPPIAFNRGSRDSGFGVWGGEGKCEGDQDKTPAFQRELEGSS